MKWQVNGMPFSPHQSSCSNRKPMMFSWEDIDGDVELWIDDTIEIGLTTEKRRAKKYAWLCESRSIIPFFSNFYSLDEKGNMVVDGITPILQDIIDEYDGIFTCDKDLVKLHDKIHFCFAGSTLPWVSKENWDMHRKDELCSFISSNKNLCKGHQKRHDVHDMLKNEFREPTEDNPYPPVHVFGSITGKILGHQPGCHLAGGSEKWHDKFDALDRFTYSIVIENDVYPSYFTEKLTDCFVTGTVPIYWGAPDIGDYFDTGGMFLVNSVDEIKGLLEYFHTDMNYKKEYMSRLSYLRNNFHKVTFMESPDDMLYRKITQLKEEVL